MEGQKEKEVGENIKNDRTEAESDEDDNDVFAAVLSAVRLDRLPAFCASIRNQSTITDRIEQPVIGQAIFGSYHVLFPFTFQDGVRWLLKIPACGTTIHFDSSASAALRSEALTMRLIRRETSVPVPDVFAFDASLENEVGCPFILMSFIEGASLYDCWFDRAVSADQLQLRRSRTLKDLAQAMAELGRLSFDCGGSLIFDERDALNGIGPMRCVDHKGMLDKVFSDDKDGDETALYFDAGPFPDPISFYILSTDREDEPKDPLQKSLRQLLLMFIEWIPEPQEGHQKFVLTHPDLDIQNLIVSADGRLQGLIDWDGVDAVPRSVGNEKYPSWLTRDWDPAVYGWDEDMERCIEPVGLWEDSPETLARHRKEYETFVRSGKGAQDVSHSSPPASLTAQSLFVENLLIATEDPACRFEIVEKFFITIKEVLYVNTNRSNTTKPNSTSSIATDQLTSIADYDIFDILDEWESGEITQQHVATLRKGFIALFNQGSGISPSWQWVSTYSGSHKQ